MHGRMHAGVETLESRTLFASAAVVGDTLVVRGNLPATNEIVVADSADGSAVDVSVTSVSRRGVTKTFTASFPKSLGFAGVHVRGGLRADVVTLGSDAVPFAMPARVNGLAGDDTITTGSGNDVIAGGLGDDLIRAGAGDDAVHAGRGDDQLFGGDGDDALWGGGGSDALFGGAGNDRLGGILGANALFGGDGQDHFVVRALDLNPEHDYTAEADLLTLVTNPKQDTANPAGV